VTAQLTKLEPISDTVRALLDDCPLGLVILDRALRVHYVNRAALELAGLPGPGRIGQPLAERLGTRAWASLKPFIERAIRGERNTSTGWVDYPGGRRFVTRHYAPIVGEGGGVLGCFGCIEDHTSQMNTERRAAEIERTKSAMIDAALDCIVAIDETGAILEFNPAAEKTFGRRRVDVLGRPIAEVLVPPAHRAAHLAGFARYLKTGKARLLGKRVEIEAMRADGSLFPVELTLTEIKLPDRRIFTAHLRDLSERRAAEAEIARQRDALQHAQTLTAMGSLLAAVAHELNNPLAIVLGQATMLAEEVKPGPLRRRVERLREAAERSAAVVRTFLAMARQRPPARRVIEMGEVCRTAMRLLEYGLTADGIAIKIEIDPRTPPVEGDPDQLHQVVANLIVNAQHALRGTEGPRRIRIAVERNRAGQVVTKLDDNGPGVKPELVERIFEPFFTTRSTGQGTGIGLAVSRGIVAAHGGTIVCERGKLGGARFVVRLPASRAAAARAKPKPARRVVEQPARRRALVIDDEPEIAALLAEIIEGKGWTVERAGNGREAVRKLKGQSFDAIFSDLRMPGLDGRGLREWLAENRPELADRLVLVTGDFAAVPDMRDGKTTIIEKPFGPAEVRRVLADLTATAPKRKQRRRA